MTPDDRTFESFLSDMTKTYGVVLGTKSLCTALGFRSDASLRQGMLRRTLGFPIFKMPGRAGHFALTADVASTIWAERERAQLGARMDDGLLEGREVGTS